jgi:hypothetical protein
MKRIAFAAIAALALGGCQSTAPEEPQPAPQPAAPPPVVSGGAALDSSVIITPPGSKVQKRYAAFSGIWAGTWDGVQDAKLAVRNVATNGTVKVTYAWGDMGDMNPGIVDGEGKINAAGRLKLDRLPNGINVSFSMQQDGTLAGTYTVLENPQPHTGVFTKQQ